MDVPTPPGAHALVDEAQAAYGRRDWLQARGLFKAARTTGRLSADHLYALSDACWWAGDNAGFFEACEDAHRTYLEHGQPRRAAIAALDIAVASFLKGDETAGSGWLGRARRLLDGEPESAEHGYIFYVLEVEGPIGGIVSSEDPAVATILAAARRVQDMGRRFGDPTLSAIGLLGEGRVLVKACRMADGLALLDEAMVAVRSDALNPAWAGSICCQLMSAAEEVGDMRRARAWTESTAAWLASMPVAVVFNGICRVHRSRVHQRCGEWDEAEREAADVCETLAGIHPGATAEAHYQMGEIRRLRGDLAGAEAAYERAHELGHEPQPGYALLRLAQNRVSTAATSIRSALLAEQAPLRRAPLRAAQVEIALAAGETAEAHAASDELDAIAARYGSSGLDVAARHARGAILLAEGRVGDALPLLRDACRGWSDVDAPYDCARVRVLLAGAYRAAGDEDAARRELAVARRVFERLGAMLDAHRIGEGEAPADRPADLTPREVEVLQLVAEGLTNRDIAARLAISEKTVARHLSNIFVKLDVSTRTAATAFAFAHGLARPSSGWDYPRRFPNGLRNPPDAPGRRHDLSCDRSGSHWRWRRRPAMSRTSDIRERFTRSVANSDLDGIVDCYRPDAVLVVPEGRFEGQAGVREYFKAQFEAFSEQRLETTAVHDRGDTGITEWTYTGVSTGPVPLPDGSTIPPTNQRVSQRGADVFETADGRIRTHRVYYDQLELLQQLQPAQARR